MPNHESAWKRMRQNEQRRARNRAHRSHLRRAIKSFGTSQETGSAKDRIPALVSVVDKAAKKGIIHRRKAARIKSRVSSNTTVTQ